MGSYGCIQMVSDIAVDARRLLDSPVLDIRVSPIVFDLVEWQRELYPGWSIRFRPVQRPFLLRPGDVVLKAAGCNGEGCSVTVRPHTDVVEGILQFEWSVDRWMEQTCGQQKVEEAYRSIYRKARLFLEELRVDWLNRSHYEAVEEARKLHIWWDYVENLVQDKRYLRLNTTLMLLNKYPLQSHVENSYDSIRSICHARSKCRRTVTSYRRVLGQMDYVAEALYKAVAYKHMELFGEGIYSRSTATAEQTHYLLIGNAVVRWDDRRPIHYTVLADETGVPLCPATVEEALPLLHTAIWVEPKADGLGLCKVAGARIECMVKLIEKILDAGDSAPVFRTGQDLICIAE